MQIICSNILPEKNFRNRECRKNANLLQITAVDDTCRKNAGPLRQLTGFLRDSFPVMKLDMPVKISD